MNKRLTPALVVLLLLNGALIARATSLQLEPMLWPNNVNTTLVTDNRGNAQNVAYMDNENDFVLGPGTDDPALMGVYVPTPINLYKRHEVDDFVGNRPQLGWAFSGPGSYVMPAGDSQIEIHSGSGTEQMSLPGTQYVLGYGTTLRFYATTEDVGYQQITMGTRVIGSLVWCQFRLTEAATRDRWLAECANGVTSTVVDTQVLNDNGRRMFMLDMRAADRVDFWISDPAQQGAMVLRASITTNIPLAPQAMVPAVTIGTAYGGSADRRLLLDLFYGIRNR